MFSDAGFGTPPQHRISRRGRRAACGPRRSWRPIEQATMAYGHGISVNLVQLARAYTIFATDGELKPVTLFKTDGAGRRAAGDQAARPRARCAGCSSSATQPGGTAPKAQVAGYRVAGKTGTAHKLEGRGYAQQVRLVVRRLRAGVASAADRRGDDRRARRRPVLRRRRRRAGVLERHRCRRCACSACRPTRRSNNVILPPDGSRDSRGNVTASATLARARRSIRRC